MESVELLFSYGTLQQTKVQIDNFGRELIGFSDALVGYKLRTIEITDEDVISINGRCQHQIAIATCDCSDRIDGMVFEITKDELDFVDKYEVTDYMKVECRLKSGKNAWVYVCSNNDINE